jgi:sugar lactone lactonase YvrE
MNHVHLILKYATSYETNVLSSRYTLVTTWMSLSLSLLVTPNARWAQHGITVAGGHGRGNSLQQLCCLHSIVVDDDDTVFIADHANHRIVAWKKGDNEGHVVAGGQGSGNGFHQLNYPTDVLIDKETKSLIICDQGNRRVIRRSLNNDTRGETLVDNIDCSRLAMDKQGCLYVNDYNKHEVRRYTGGDTKGTVVAGANGEGDRLNQFHYPCYMFVDAQQSLYVSDHYNHRVMKWLKRAKEGKVVAGGEGRGEELTQLHYPRGLWVDDTGTVYVAECNNDRVTRWPKGGKRGVVLVGGNGEGNATNQFKRPVGLSFDRRGNMYVADHDNHRVQQFKSEQ